jgi:hypothetical protein
MWRSAKANRFNVTRWMVMQVQRGTAEEIPYGTQKIDTY